MIARSFWYYGDFYYQNMIGVLGWLSLYLPSAAYVLPAGALLLSVLAQPRHTPRLRASAAAWNVLLLGASVLLTMTWIYLYGNEVGAWMLWRVQGRYFLPLLALAVATVCSVVRLRPSRKASQVAFAVITVIIATELLIANLAIVRAYQLF
jgi:uncharacterized membrane protein